MKRKMLHFVFVLSFLVFFPACQKPPVSGPASQDLQIDKKQTALQQRAAITRLKEEGLANALSYEIVGRTELEKEKQVGRLADTIVTRSASTSLKSGAQGFSLSPQAVYQKALSALLAGDALSARKGFTDFQKKWPDNSLNPNVLYWLGESYYAQEEYVAALLSFKEVWERYPDHPKAPDAMLKAAYSCINLKNIENAKLYLQTILDKYPHSRSAVLALCKLRTL